MIDAETDRPAARGSLAGKSVLISGGCGALGMAILRRLTADGARVGVVDILPENEANGVLAGIGVDVYIRDSCASAASAQRVIDLAEAGFGGLPDVVACHAGIVASSSILDVQEAEFDRVFETNVRSAFLLAQASASAWVRANRRGLLVFTSSWVASTAWPGIATYAASKAALESLANSFAAELAVHGIRSNVLAPGIVNAGMARKQWDEDPAYRSTAQRAIALGVLQPVESVANAFSFLCSDDSSYMTGNRLTIDGGCSLYPQS